MTREEFIHIFPAFRRSPDDFINDMLSASVRKQFKKGSMIYSHGDACPGIGFFLSGSVRVFELSESGREVTLYEIFPGETCILNASSILTERDYPANASAVSDGEMLLLPDKVFRTFISDYEDMRKFIFSLFSQRLFSIMELVEEILFDNMDKRLVAYLIEKADNNSLNVTHQQIANDLGTSREVVSRLLKDLEKKGKVILTRHMIRLVNI